MGMLARRKPGYPFAYVGHGVAAARKHMWCQAVFAGEVPESERGGLLDGLPSLMAEFADWQGRVLTFGHASDSLQWAVRAAYDQVKDPDAEHEDDEVLPSEMQWRAFNEDIDRWLMQVHERFPIAVFLKPIDVEYGTALTEWHDWSLDRAVTEVVPALEAAAAGGTAGYVRALWQAREDERNAPEPGPEPGLDDLESTWRQILAEETGERLEDRYERAFEGSYKLGDYFDALVEAGRIDDAIALCRLVLERGAEFEGHWWTRLGRLLVDGGRIDEAEEAIREVVWRLESYQPHMLVLCMDYHRARGEHDKEAAAFFGGKLFYTVFNHSVTKERARGYGPVPPDGRDLYARWLHDWIGDRLEPRAVKRVGHWLVWFDKLESPVFAAARAAIEAERDRRIGLRKAIAAATDEARVEALVAELRQVPADADDMLACAYEIHQAFPRAAYDLLEHGLRSDGVTGYKRHGFLRAANNLLYQCLQTEELLGRADDALALALPWGRRNPGIFHNAACIAARLGRRTEALSYVRAAVESNYDRRESLRSDDDLVGLGEELDALLG